MDWKAGFDNAFSDVFRCRNLLLLAASWLGGVFLFVAYGTLSGQHGPCEPYITRPPVALHDNETGAVEARRKVIRAGSPVSCKIAFDNLLARDSAAGIFRTASGKHVHIDNLRVVFEQSVAVCPSDPGNNVGWRHFRDLLVPNRQGGSGTGQLPILEDFGADTTDWSARIDLANTTNVEIRNLTWRICEGPRDTLQVQCKYARLRGDGPHIVLRGHAVITTAGATLESNHIEMNVPDECFVVRGRYVLTRGQRKEAGFDACFDRALRIAGAPPSETGESKGWANGWPLGAF